MNENVSAQDIREFKAYLRVCTNAQVQGVYDKEIAASRTIYAELAKSEAESRGIDLVETVMKTERTDEQKEALRDALALVATTQEAFWDALSDFESLAGVELENMDNHDFTVYSDPTDEDVEAVLESDNDDEEESEEA